MAITVITGANRGIGLELARQLHERGDTVVALVRKSSAELDALGVRVRQGVDVTSDDDAREVASELSGETIDRLILNAGILGQVSLDNLNFDDIRRQFEVNSLGPLRMTSALLRSLDKGSKIALITSRMGSLADNTSGSHYGYRMSKAALNMAGVSLSVDLRSRGISVCILHPGWVRTEMTGGTGNITAAQSASGLIGCIDRLDLETSGTFWHTDGSTLPW